MGPPRKNRLTSVFRPTQKMGPDGPKWGQEDFFPTNPDLADILGRTDFDFENFYFLDFLGPKFLAWAHLGPAWAHPLGPPVWAAIYVNLFIAVLFLFPNFLSSLCLDE